MEQTSFYYIYLFREIESQKVIYVGSTRTIGARINEHRRGFREEKRRQPIHRYMLANHLELFKDVEIAIVDTANSKEEALQKETEYTERFKDSVANIWKGEEKSILNTTVRKPVSTPDGKQCYSSMREAADALGITRHQVYKLVEKGELVETDVSGMYVNELTGETFISGYQIQKRYNLDAKSITKLSRDGEIIIRGMKIKKV